jgi:ribonuclease T2
MKQYAGFIALAVLSIAAAGWITIDGGVTTGPESTVLQRTGTSPPGNQTVQPAQGSGFDFYVLSLSWSPTFCQSEAGRNNRQQCNSNRNYGFVVHGLWPQNEKGYPQFCGKDREERVPDSLGRDMLDIMPSMGLIGHQWRKHGSCSGLTQEDYLQATRAAYDRIKLPDDIALGKSSKIRSIDDIETAFISANPSMEKQGIAVTCEGRKMEEVRICMTKDLTFRRCPEVDRQGCRANDAEITPIR